MAAQRLRSEALPGTGGGLELIDWLDIRHDESEPVVEATRSALHYLRTLKQSIPTGPAPVVTNHDDADETEDGDALEGSQGITKRELLERQVHLPRPATCAALPRTATIANGGLGLGLELAAPDSTHHNPNPIPKPIFNPNQARTAPPSLP